jgi:hypothetical protein
MPKAVLMALHRQPVRVLAATAAEPRLGKSAGGTGLRQWRAALGAEAPPIAIFSRTFLTEHAVPVRGPSKRLGTRTQHYISWILRLSGADYIA